MGHCIDISCVNVSICLDMIIPADVPEIAGTIHTSMSVNKSTNIVARVSLLTGGEETIMVVMTHYTFTYNSHFN